MIRVYSEEEVYMYKIDNLKDFADLCQEVLQGEAEITEESGEVTKVSCVFPGGRQAKSLAVQNMSTPSMYFRFIMDDDQDLQYDIELETLKRGEIVPESNSFIKSKIKRIEGIVDGIDDGTTVYGNFRVKRVDIEKSDVAPPGVTEHIMYIVVE